MSALGEIRRLLYVVMGRRRAILKGMVRGAFRLLFLLFAFAFGFSAEANYRNQFQFGGGVSQVENAQKAHIFVAAEFEHRLGRGVGIGLLGNYITTSPATSLIAIPEFFFHPTGDVWFVNVGPIFQQQGSHDSAGIRAGTRILFFSTRILKLATRFEVDFINGNRRYMVGAGIEFHTI